jgi:hypothetical protein
MARCGVPLTWPWRSEPSDPRHAGRACVPGPTESSPSRRRATQELLTLYVVERWLARLGRSRFIDQFVLKGGMLLAAFDARRTTADADALARGVANDEASVLERVVAIADLAIPDDGVVRPDTAVSRVIRDQDLYAGVRISMDCAIATAIVKLRLDINFGDPITPAAQLIDLPPLRPGDAPIRILGYPIEAVLAEKIATAISLGPVNTRVRDYADIYMLTGNRSLEHAAVRLARIATAAHRGTEVVALSEVIQDLVELRAATYTAYRSGLGPDGMALPADFLTVVRAVTAFADALVDAGSPLMYWDPATRGWSG